MSGGTVSPPGRPKGEHRSAQHEGCLIGGGETGSAASASFTAVAEARGADDDAESNPSSRPPERRAPGRRLDDAALRAVHESRRFVFALVASAWGALAGGAWLAGGPGAAGTIGVALPACALAGAAALLVRRHTWHDAQRRELHRWMLGIGVALWLTLALAPWLAVADSAMLPGRDDAAALVARADTSALVAFVLGTGALAFAGVLAPRIDMALAGAALPLPAALASAGNGASLPPLPAALCVLASALAVLLALTLHRRWRAAAGNAFAQAERILALEAARDAAIRADQEKSRFLAIASHDLRQPVHAIGLFAATLEKRLEGSTDEPLVRNLSRAIDGLDRSFNVLLDISRLDAGAIEPRVQHFPLRDLFRRLHMHFAGQAEQKGLGLRFSPGGKSVGSDPQLLERILGNLVQNAIKYTERGGIVVVARSTRTHLNVEVWDTGIGIRAADLRKIFDEFYQVGRTGRVRAQGLGMGLAIVKRLVRLLGHELTVASRPGRGTCFRLRIALGALPGIQEATAPADTLPMPLLQPRTVLVLDDEEAIRDGLCLLLEEWGYDAIAAGSIDAAERAVESLETPPDLILSDLHLGDGPDGIAAIEAIRRRCGCEVAAMLITGDTSHAEIRRATDSGHPVLFKPVQPRKLYDALRGIGT